MGFKGEVKEVTSGTECGVSADGFKEWQVGLFIWRGAVFFQLPKLR